MKTDSNMRNSALNLALILSLAVSPLALAGGAAPKMNPDQAFSRLQQGNARFVAGEPQHPNTGAQRMKETSEHGQHPFATVITCSDSRVPVERIFDEGIGDIFVIRVAGNVCDVDEIGSIEYGVDHLQTPVLVVLGHTQCGAVTAVATGAELHGSIPPLVDNIGPAVEAARSAHPDLKGKDLVPEAIKANVWQSIDDLMKRSPATRKRVKAGTLKVIGAVYDIVDGRVDWLGEHPELKRLLNYTTGPDAHDLREHGDQHECHGDSGYSNDDYHTAAAAAKRSPDKAIEFLKQGNERFVSGQSIQPNIDQSRLQQAGRENQGDHAFATVITCSDSRVPVEHIFDVGVMDTFIIRIAGNVCDTDEIGSIEYGLAHVKTPVLVVLGHTQCGAVTAVTHAVHGKGHALERNIPPLVDNIQPAVERAIAKHQHVHGDDIIPHAIEENVWQSIEDLFTESPATRNLVKSGKAKVVGAIYDVGTGRVHWLSDSKPAQILAMVETNPDRAMNAMAGGDHDDHDSAPHVAAGRNTHGQPAGGEHAAAPEHVEVQPVPVTVIESARLRALDQARHNVVHGAAVELPAAEQGIPLVWKLLAGLVILGFAAWLVIRSGALGNLGVAGKMYGGFATVVLLGVAGGWFGYRALDQVTEESALALAAVDLDVMAAEMGSLQNEFVLVGIADEVRGEKILEHHSSLAEEYQAKLDHIHDTFHLDKVEQEALGSIADASDAYEESFAGIVRRFHEVEELKDDLEELGAKVDEQLAHMLHEHEQELLALEAAGAPLAEIVIQTQLVTHLADCEALALRVANNETGFLLDKDVARIPLIEEDLGQLRGELQAVRSLIPQAASNKADEAADLAIISTLQNELDAYQTSLAKVIEDELIVAAQLLACTGDVETIERTANAFAHRAEDIAVAAKQAAHSASIALMIIVVVVGSLCAFFITRGITRPITRIVSGLTEGAAQVSDAAGQVSTASQSLAEGASEQAASLEETSSALEQMAAVTRKNADNAGKANTLAGQARTNANEGDETMAQLNAAMSGINESSDKIGKIIKVIEEIAFQTNLLALNAAVEAARAGEHGKGFAVVAEEVRNLAMRAADAARETTGLIEESVSRARQGTGVADLAAKSLQSIAHDVSQVADLLDGITRASSEQAQGVDQINTAVSQMDSVTQQNSAAAEESASAAEQLAAQSATLRQIVQELSSVIGAGSNIRPAAVQRSQPQRTAPAKAPREDVGAADEF